MLDFLEHFEYGKNSRVLDEAWRLLVPRGLIEIQVPDFRECANAVIQDSDYLCHSCGRYLRPNMYARCDCGMRIEEISDAAMMRLYGGQDRPGNYHYYGFTRESLVRKLKLCGFESFEFPERNQNGETYRQNWNIKVIARKSVDLWRDDG